jgi:hypothetical protein
VFESWKMVLAVDCSDRAERSVHALTRRPRIDLGNGQLDCFPYGHFSGVSVAVEGLAALVPLTVHGLAEPDFRGISTGFGYSFDATLLVLCSLGFNPHLPVFFSVRPNKESIERWVNPGLILKVHPVKQT